MKKEPGKIKKIGGSNVTVFSPLRDCGTLVLRPSFSNCQAEAAAEGDQWSIDVQFCYSNQQEHQVHAHEKQCYRDKVDWEFLKRRFFNRCEEAGDWWQMESCLIPWERSRNRVRTTGPPAVVVHPVKKYLTLGRLGVDVHL